MKNILLLCFILLSSAAAYTQVPNIVIDSALGTAVGGYYSPNEPCIAVSPRNPRYLIAGSNVDNYYYSTDTGRTWVRSTITSGFGVYGDPVALADNDGHFYYFHMDRDTSITIWPAFCNQMVCQWTDTAHLPIWDSGAAMGYAPYPKMQDKPAVSMDMRNKIMYCSWTNFDQYGSHSPSDSSNIFFSRSMDLGRTWSTAIRINKDAGNCSDDDTTVEGAVTCVGPAGELFMAWAAQDKIVFNKSLDHGTTWMPHETVVTAVPGGWNYPIPGLFRSNGLPYIACDASRGRHNGNVYINWTDQRNGADNTDVWLVRSTNGGTTWSAPIRVNNDTGRNQQFMSAMTVDQSSGNIYVVFYDRRDTLADTPEYTNVYLAVSKDGGISFNNIRLTTAGFIPDPRFFFGDYTNIFATHNVVRPIWGELHVPTSVISQKVVTALIDTSITGTYVVDTNVSVSPAPVAGPYYNKLEVWPNPMHDAATIVYSLEGDSELSIFLTDLQGRRVATLLENEYASKGMYSFTFSATDSHVTAGIYFLSVRSTGFTQTIRVVVEQ